MDTAYLAAKALRDADKECLLNYPDPSSVVWEEYAESEPMVELRTGHPRLIDAEVTFVFRILPGHWAP